MSLVITDEFCSCGMPAEIERVTFWGCEEGHVCIADFQCVNGHRWKGELEDAE